MNDISVPEQYDLQTAALKVPPHSIEAEQAVLGGLMLAAQAYAKSIGIADDGYRLVMNCNRNGGQTVYHIHMHLLGGAPLTGGFA